MLRQRVITALLMAPVALFVVLWLQHEITALVFALLVAVGAWEWSAFPGYPQRAMRYLFVLMTVCALGALWLAGVVPPILTASAAAYVDWTLFAACIWWIAALAWISLIPARVSRSAATIAGLFVLVPAWLALVRLHAITPQLVLFLILLVVAADVGAYFGGRQFGKHKLAPRVSPGKTWEGVAGGLVAAGIMAAVGVYWFDARPVAFAALCAIVVIASVIGDLTESMFKRHVGLKDSGSLLPGHGGVLDRVDSITAAAPIFLVGLERLGVLR
jgi:phosphatidate cytidylyltransferase